MPKVQAAIVQRGAKISDGATQLNKRRYPDYRVIGLGDMVYISERGSGLNGNSTYLANKKLMKSIIIDNKAPLTVEVARLSKTQLGNVVKAIKMIGADNTHVEVEIKRKDEDGSPLLVAQVK